jgi:rhamnosyltransferase
MLVSVIIRTLNEEQYLNELLQKINQQSAADFDIETIIVDSGSTDGTLDICGKHLCKITHINQSEFSFGRSLNIGCDNADGDILVFVSGHCIPTDNEWLSNLISPIKDNVASYSYGRQQGRDSTKFSEQQYFKRTFPEYSKNPQRGYLCNNANAAISRAAWQKFRFDEELTGLEDMFLAKKLVENGQSVAYESTASVYHIHDEKWLSVRTRYEREAYALNQIMPQLHFTAGDFYRYFFSSVMSDLSAAIQERRMLRELGGIVMFRLMQYWGTYRGNHEVRQLSAEMKHKYFYPKDIEKEIYLDKNSGLVANESKQ